jgi:hypothetical protein
MASGNGGRIVPPPVPMTITQIAVVVPDMESALRSYAENLGWGPWSVFDYHPPLLHDTVVRGQPCEFRMIGAETKVDGLGFELIQPVSGPSRSRSPPWCTNRSSRRLPMTSFSGHYPRVRSELDTRR